MGKLTATRAKAVTKPGLHGDGGGLYLRVAAGGSRQWLQRVTVAGKRRDIGLGAFPAVSLAKARQAAEANRAAVADGRDPVAERRREKTPTFEAAARTVHKANQPRWRNGKHNDGWIASLERHAFPTLGKITLDRIGREDVLRVLAPIWSAKPETARRVRQRIRAILKWAQAHGFVEHNMAGEIIDGALPAMPRIKAHFRALPYREIAETLTCIEEGRAGLITKLCLRFLVLTAARSGEARGAVWTEIDMDSAEWRIPAARMKANAEHRVPLSDAALDALRQARRFRDDGGLVFPSSRSVGRSLSDMTLTKMLRDAGLADRTTVHGFRSSFRDWCAETGKPRELAEAALAHTVGGVEGAYFRSDLFERRRRLMDEWAAFLTGEHSGNIVPLQSRHA